MQARRCLVPAVVPVVALLAACNPRPKGDGAVACGDLEARNDTEVELCNELEQAVIAKLAIPEGTPPEMGWPTVVMLHGSGGLFRYGEPCTEELHDQFLVWIELLNARGVAVVMPASFYSRGFCDWHEERNIPRELSAHERLVVRTLDARAAAEWTCEDERLDCGRMALLGFSNGGSITQMVMHEDLGTAEDKRLNSLETEPYFVGAVAYYPGCGLHGELSSDLDSEELGRFYYPYAPMWIAHAERDSLLSTCEDVREPQTEAVAASRDVNEDWYDLRVYPGASHGFDALTSGSNEADVDARQAAQTETLARLDSWFAN